MNDDPKYAATATLKELAAWYFSAVFDVCNEPNYEHRKPLERFARMLWGIGDYRFHGQWQEELRKLGPWPTPLPQFEGVKKTHQPWDEL